MNKALIISTLTLCLFMTACDFGKIKKESTEAVENLSNEFVEVKAKVENTVDEVQEATNAVKDAINEVDEAIEAVKDL